MSTIEAAREAGVTVRQLNHWAATGYLHPRRETGRGQGGGYWSWPAEEVDRAEVLGVLARAVKRPDLFALLANAIENGTSLVIADGWYDVVVSWRPSEKFNGKVPHVRKGETHGTNDTTTKPATA